VMNILILSAGGHAQVIADVLLCAHHVDNPAVSLGYLDDPKQTGLSVPMWS